MTRRLLTLLVAVLPVSALLVAPAGAAVPTASFVAQSAVGLVNILDPTGAGNPTKQAASFKLQVGDQEVVVFCVDQPKSVNVADPYTMGVTSASWAPTVATLAARHASLGTPLADANAEAAATQLAIWTLTNGLTLSSGTVPDAAVRGRAQALLAASLDLVIVPTTIDPTLTLSAAAVGAATQVTATTTGAPPGTPVTVALNGAYETVLTDESGVATVSLPGFGAVTAQAKIALGPGLVFTPPGDDQPMITATALEVLRDASATSEGPVAPTVPPTAGPVVTAAPPTAPAGELPYTGTSRSPWLIALGVGLVAVAGLAGWRWRTRTSA